jgi:hypothetical protein
MYAKNITSSLSHRVNILKYTNRDNRRKTLLDKLPLTGERRAGLHPKQQAIRPGRAMIKSIGERE